MAQAELTAACGFHPKARKHKPRSQSLSLLEGRELSFTEQSLMETENASFILKGLGNFSALEETDNELLDG